MNDVWYFDTSSQNWSQINPGEDSYNPAPRSGHTAVLHNGKMYIFGGLFKLQHELNDLIAYDIVTKSFKKIDGEDVIVHDEAQA